ncbi:unnamed protein product [Periconia digitata]|uniref:Uncharacterized protein n=1 Tax=Periconia digitata TaxID=1303443 RepID=A0A9W4XQJ4_9PLEO|nr:unnamed protein product [Periconia digitata]
MMPLEYMWGWSGMGRGGSEHLTKTTSGACNEPTCTSPPRKSDSRP